MTPPRIDCLQYCNWSEAIFRELRAGGLDAVHVTVAYHEDFRESVERIIDWKRRFSEHGDLILHARSTSGIDHARATNRTAIIFGFQNCSPIEDDIGLVEVCHELGVRFMQLTYNNQSLLGAGCYEAEDAGITRMGREVISEMNRLGVIIDMSHSSERTTLDAIRLSKRPIAITHANPASWHDVPRNKPDKVLDALKDSGGMLGLSLYPHHLAGGPACTLEAFCCMAAKLAERIGVAHIGIGSDLCQGQPDSVVEWMRNGRWTRGGPAAFPPQPAWFRSNRDWGNLDGGLKAAGFSANEVAAILGGNWYRFFGDAWG